MKYTHYLLGGLSCLLLFTTPIVAQELSGDAILQRVDALLDIKNSDLEFELQVYREQELRKTYRMRVQYEEWEYALAETLHPPRNKGEKMLMQGKNVWTYLPKINKVMRVSESNSFSNSDFSNMDIMNPQLSEDYSATVLGVENENGTAVYTLELLAKGEDVPYAKILYWVRKSDLYPLRREYYTFSGHLLKQLVLETKNANLRNGMPDFFTMTNVLEKDKYTVMQILKLESGKTFPPETFRQDALAKR